LYHSAWSYHTGAGQSIPSLQAKKDGSAKSYFNGTRLNIDLGSDFPWGWVPGYLTYAAWAPVEINGGMGSEGFKLDKTAGVVWQSNDWIGERTLISRSSFLKTKKTDFGSKACDWTYGVPQVFTYSSYYKTALPCSCAKIRLIPEYI
jgi:hypothetical protein